MQDTEEVKHQDHIADATSVADAAVASDAAVVADPTSAADPTRAADPTSAADPAGGADLRSAAGLRSGPREPLAESPAEAAEQPQATITEEVPFSSHAEPVTVHEEVPVAAAEAQAEPEAHPDVPPADATATDAVPAAEPMAVLPQQAHEPAAQEAPAMTTEDVMATGTTNAAPAGADETARAHMKAIIEAVTYITDEPLTSQQICAALQQPMEVVQSLLDELLADYAKPERGLSIREVAGGFKMATKPEHHEAIRTFVKNLKPPLKLSLAALETLAVIAYKQPITAPEIMEIRGVGGAGVLKTLLDRKLIATAGRKNVVGKPILYKTTKDFLLQFGLKDLAELPTLKEFEELGRLAIHDTDLYEESKNIAAASEKTAEAPPNKEQS